MLKPFTTRLEEEYIDAITRYSKATGMSIQVILNNIVGNALNHKADPEPKPDNRSNYHPLDNHISDIQEIL